MPALTSLAIGLGAAGLAAGAIKGASDAPDAVQNTTSSTDFGPMSGDLRQAQQNSLENYLQQQSLAGDFQNSIKGAGDMQSAARDQYLNQLNGSAFQATPQELQNIQNLRDAQVSDAQAQVGSMLDERFKGVADSAGMRGVRGQALGELYGQQAKIGADQLGAAVRQANAQAAQMAIDTPMKRAQMQQGMIQQGMSYQDMMNQQAQQNRQALQDPALLKYLQQQYISGGTKTSSQVTPGQKGSFINGVMGGVSGAAGGIGLGGGMANAFGQMRGFDQGTQAASLAGSRSAANLAASDLEQYSGGVSQDANDAINQLRLR